MSSIPKQTLSNWSRLTPANVNTLEDLKPFGALDLKIFNQVIKEQSIPPYQIKILQPRESKFWKKNPWQYTINEYNFRDVWDFEDTRKRIGFFGCSFTAGEGIESSDLHVNIVAKHFNLNVFNFGAGGASIERVARTFSAVNGLLDLDYAVVTLPTWYRQLHIDELGNMVNLIPSWICQGYKKLGRIMTSLDEDYYAIRAASNINWIYDIAKHKGIKILFSSWDHTTNEFCKHIATDYTINPFPNIDDKKARDRLHPGVKSQQAHADQIIKGINDRAWI